MTNLKELVYYFVSRLVNDPEKVVINEISTETKEMIEIRVNGSDLARVIGKEGRIFRALRNLVQAVDPSSKKDIVIDVIS